jgi:hypothetical protein
LNESRALEYRTVADIRMSNALWAIEDEKECSRLLNFITNNKNSFEAGILLAAVHNSIPSQAWRNFVRASKITCPALLRDEAREAQDDELVVSETLYNFFASEGLLNGAFYSQRGGTFKTVKPTAEQLETLVRACDYCRVHFGISIDPNTVSVGKFPSQSKTMAFTFNGSIVVNMTVIEEGFKPVCKCLVEEWLHITTGASDCSYEMQHAYLNLLMSISSELESKGIKLYGN